MQEEVSFDVDGNPRIHIEFQVASYINITCTYIAVF